MRGRVVVVGAVNRDLVTMVARLPAPGETVAADAILRLWGGKAANAAVAAARLGAEAVLVCAVGGDADGTAALDDLRGAGVDVRADRVGEPTGVAVVLVDARGENSIVVQAGANGALRAEHVRAVLAGLALGRADVLVLSTEVPAEPLRAAATVAAATGTTVFLSPAPVPAGGVDPALLPAGHGVVVVNEHEDAGVSRGTGAHVVSTLGPRGAVLLAPDGTRHAVPGRTVTAVDSTGAGDAFLGALAAEVADGVALPAALATAVCAGAYAVTGRGARHHATRADLAALGG